MARAQPVSKREGHPSSLERRCEAVYQATLAIATELSLDAALQKIVEAARNLVDAEYGALGVVDEERRRLTRFVVSGISDEEVRRIEHWPRGLGLLGELIHFPHPLRVRDISKDPRSVGFPPHHPTMTSFLGVPIIRGGTILGNFYMTNKKGAKEFSEEDEEILSLFAAQAAVAIENARLYTETDIRLKEKVIEVERAEMRARFLAELGAVLLRLSPGDELPLRVLTENATEALGDAVGIYLVAPDKLDQISSSGLFHRIGTRREAAREVVERSWEALARLVVAQGRPALAAVRAPVTISAFDVEALERGRFVAALAVPIATRQSVYGILVSLASRPLTLEEDDVRFATLIADRLGSSLDTANLYRKEREARAQVEELAALAQDRASELETILDTMTEVVWVVDSEMRVVRTNKAFSDWVGGDEAKSTVGWEELALDILRYRHENGELMTVEDLPVSRALRGETFTNLVVTITGRDSKERYFSISGAPLRDTAGQIVAAVTVGRDVTEVKQLDNMRDEFISVASHELKTPLTVVKGYGQLLLQKLDAIPNLSAEAGMARRILDQANRMSTLAERLLDVSRIQFGRLQLEKQRVDVARLVRDVAESMQVGIHGRSIRVTGAERLPAMIDPQRIEQVLSNLISNAAKYSSPQSPIDVSVQERKGEVTISVRDQGFGIPEEQQAYIFQRFFRAATSKGRTGLGLGLYVSKGIVEAHGGRIWFDSKEGEGTTFYVMLPTAPPKGPGR